MRFALNVFIGSTALWLLLRHLAGVSPIWAIASLIAASEPVMKDALRMARASLINTTVGCAVGLAVLLMGGSSEWRLPAAISIAVLVSSYFVHIPNMWRQAPITAAIIIASGLTEHSQRTAAEQGLAKVAEVFLGCLAGVAISWLMAHLWRLPAADPAPGQ
ncbi:FUSC family protein [Methylocella sp.]|uniref:FUSC family protein n=1 Tax=Methylocella sp. TaxID=1978226 RepID=UPI003783CC2F